MNYDKFLTDVDTLKAKLLKATGKKLAPLQQERAELEKRRVSLLDQKERQLRRREELAQQVDEFKLGQVNAAMTDAEVEAEEGAPAPAMNSAAAEDLARLRASVELCESLLLKIESELAATTQRGKEIQGQVYQTWKTALAPVHAEMEKKFKEMHTALSTFHASYMGAQRAAFNEVMAEDGFPEFQGWNDPRNLTVRGWFMFTPLNHTNNDFSIYRLGQGHGFVERLA